MVFEYIRGVLGDKPINNIRSIQGAKKKPKKQNKKDEKVFQETMEDIVDISADKNVSPVSDEKFANTDSTDSENQVDKLPGGVINIVAK